MNETQKVKTGQTWRSREGFLYEIMDACRRSALVRSEEGRIFPLKINFIATFWTLESSK